MQTLVETPEYIRRTEKLLDEDERANLSKAERNMLAELVDLLVSAWQKE